MTEPWKTWLVTLHIVWSHDATFYNATVTAKIRGTSSGHAISRATTSIARWNVAVTDATADRTS